MRGMTAKAAAAHANANAVKSKGRAHDDVTVIVVDFVPQESDAKAPGLARKQQGGGKGGKGVQIWRPLETPSATWRCVCARAWARVRGRALARACWGPA